MSSPIPTTPTSSRQTRSRRRAGPELRLVWNIKQSRFLKSLSPYLNLEGGVRAGKSFVLCFKLLFYCINYPGIHCALTRWTQDGLDAQLRPIWRSVCKMAGVQLQWHPDEEYDELPNGSLVYLRALKASEDTQRYSKLAGLTLAILAIDQAEEVPEDVYRHYVPARLSQPGFPHQTIITPNPPTEDSWIAKDWPEKGGDARHEYIHTTPYDNRAVLGEEYITELEAAYKPGSLEFRRLVQGKRGLMVAGVPIFGRHFVDSTHVPAVPVEYDPLTPLCESWDYGTLHPCVTWCQFLPMGIMVVLGGVMGIDLNLEQFVPLVEEYRARWFPDLGATLLQQTCDPAGSTANSHGTDTGVSVLRNFGVYPTIRENANHPPVKATAIEMVVGYLSRTTHDDRPCFLLNPRFVVVGGEAPLEMPVLQNALAAGYVYDGKRNYIGTTYPHLRPPKKDGWYEHPADSLLYNVTAFAPPDAAEQAGVIRNAAAERRARATLQRAGIEDASTVDVRKMAARIVTSHAELLRAKQANRDLRRAQKDEGETFRWSRARSVSGRGRGGY